MYNRLVYFGVIPQVGLAILLTCATHLDPLPNACTCCVFQFRCWSNMMPRYLAFSEGLIIPCGSTSGVLFMGLHLWAKSIRASLEYLSEELCSVDQSPTPPSLVIIFANLWCVSVKVSAVAIKIVSSIYADADSPAFSGISRRSVL